jgi:hypothetical protein
MVGSLSCPSGRYSGPQVRLWEVWQLRRSLPGHAVHKPHEREIGIACPL